MTIRGGSEALMVRTTKADQGLESIAEIARSASGRSPLYRWLRVRHDAFMELVNENRPNWKALAEGFAELGLLSLEGKPLTPEAVRHTWWRVRKDVAASRQKRTEKSARQKKFGQSPPP